MRADREFQEWMAELADEDEDEDGRRLEVRARQLRCELSRFQVGVVFSDFLTWAEMIIDDSQI